MATDARLAELYERKIAKLREQKQLADAFNQLLTKHVRGRFSISKHAMSYFFSCAASCAMLGRTERGDPLDDEADNADAGQFPQARNHRVSPTTRGNTVRRIGFCTQFGHLPVAQHGRRTMT